MSAPSNQDPRLEQAAASDESLLAAHEALLGKQPDEKARYKLLPLNLLFFFSGLIFFAGTYLNRYSGQFDPHIYNENARPHKDGGEAAQALTPEQIRENGKKFFNNAACNTCHQTNGLGTPGAIPPLVASEWVAGSEERIIRIVLHGLQGPIKVKGVDYTSMMPPFGKVPGSPYNWSDEKIAAVLTYIRSEWGNTSGPVTTEQVAAVHAKEGDHKQWTSDELAKIP